MHPKNACTISRFYNSNKSFSTHPFSKPCNVHSQLPFPPASPALVMKLQARSVTKSRAPVDAVINVGGSCCMTSILARDSHTAVISPRHPIHTISKIGAAGRDSRVVSEGREVIERRKLLNACVPCQFSCVMRDDRDIHLRHRHPWTKASLRILLW